jgi:hypothetical protein
VQPNKHSNSTTFSLTLPSDRWLTLTAYGALGFFPTTVGLVLGLATFLPARRRRERNVAAKRAVILAAATFSVVALLLAVWQVPERLA